ncbi:hypothetical protein GP486_002409 [Trichoglossum hirsutum]|uniref:Uncharacterized protein n=1 Tax=Trichoglossum hirsutum TaxID=265104 RepID=A0A9P8LEU8_9PEZI|nr:hypothetical protein GP486_002409 [Trichoglossum hirsutum]
MSKDEITHQLDPFFAECRAFVERRHEGLSRLLAVLARSFRLNLKAWLLGASEEFHWDRSSQLESFRGIIKELVSGVPHFTSEMVEKMGADLLTLSNIGVFVRDIKKDNYRGGRLTDFSASWTRLHVMLSFRESTGRALRAQKESFDEMIEGMT